jgi:hypothetical protein
LVFFLDFYQKASAISKSSVGDSSWLIISVLEIMAAMHWAVGFSNLDSSEESSKASLDNASAIKLCLPFICLNYGTNSSISKRQRITLSEVLFAYVKFLWSVCTIIL